MLKTTGIDCNPLISEPCLGHCAQPRAKNVPYDHFVAAHVSAEHVGVVHCQKQDMNRCALYAMPFLMLRTISSYMIVLENNSL